MRPTALDVVAAARTLVGVRWVHQGRTRSGLDCLGMEFLAARLAGVDLRAHGVVDRHNYGLEAMPDLLEGHRKHCRQSYEPVTGCVVLFQFERELHPRHVGIVATDGRVIHCNAKLGAVVEHGLRAQWRRWAHSYWLLPGVVYP